MMFFVGLIAAPIGYLFVLGNLLVHKDRKGIGVSLLFAALAVGTAYWSITRSRSSTAGIGILGLPLMLAVGGLLGLAFGRWRASTHGFRSVGALLSLGGVVLLIAFNLREGWKTIGKNQVRDEQQAAHSAEIERDRALIAAGLAQNENRQRAYLDSSIRARMNDRAFLIAALENDSVSRDILDQIATTTKEPTVINALLENPSLDCALLEQVARKVAAIPPNPAYQNEARIEELRPTVCTKKARK